MATIDIKVGYANQTKAFRFSSELLVAEALKEIKERFAEDTGLSFALFQPPTKSKKARWLKSNRTFKFYGITNGVELEYRKTQGPIKIKLVDDTTKTVLIDYTHVIKDIIPVIGAKLMIKNTEEYALKKMNSPEGEWLDDERTLNEEDVEDNEMLIFAKKFFSSDSNISADDPMQLHLVYIQSSNGVISGKYDPLQREEAIRLAAVQAHIIYGNYDVNKHKSGTYDLAKLLPLAWRKDKKIEKEIIKEHKILINTPEIHAKLRFVQLVRSLKTYGVTMYECIERIKGKKKGFKVLVGITRDKISLLDAETREVKKTWKIEQLRRWAAAPNAFTLDFGDHEEDYIVLQTSEGEAMSQLITGYIDIIMKLKGEAGRMEDDDEADDAYESNISLASGVSYMSASQSFTPGISSSMVNPNLMNFGHQVPGITPGSGPQSFSVDQVGSGSLGLSHMNGVFPESQKMIVFDIGTAFLASQTLQAEMERGIDGYNSSSEIPIDVWRKQLGIFQDNVNSNVDDLLAMARMDPSSYNKNNIDTTAKKLHQNMFGLAVAAKNIASLDDDIPLLTGAQSVSDSISRLLGTLNKYKDTPGDDALLDELFLAEQTLNDTSKALERAREGQYADKGVDVLIQEIISEIGDNLDDMLNSVQEGSNFIEDVEGQKDLYGLVQASKVNKDWYLASLKAVSPVIIDPHSLSRARQVASTLRGIGTHLVEKSQTNRLQPQYLDTLLFANKRLENALKNLLKSTDCAEHMGAEGELDLETPNNILVASLAHIRRNVDFPKELIAPTKTCVGSTKQILHSTKKLADGSDDVTRDRLLVSSKRMNDTMKMLLNSVRSLYQDPSQHSYKSQILDDANKLEAISQEILSDAGTTSALTNLRYASKIATAKCLKLSSALSIALSAIKDDTVRNQLESDIENISLSLDKLLNTLQIASKHPDDFPKQNDLLIAAKACIPQFHNYLIHAKRGQKNIENLTKKQNVSYSANEAIDAVKELERACKILSDLGGQTEIEESMVDFDRANMELEAAEFASQNGLLVNMEGQIRENSQELLSLASRSLTNILDQLIESSKQGGKLSHHVQHSGSAIVQLSGAARSMASTIEDRNTQQKIIAVASKVTNQTKNLIMTSRDLFLDRENLQKQDLVQREGHKVKVALANLLASARSLEASECDVAIALIKEAISQMRDDLPPGSSTQKQNIEVLVSVTKALTAVISQLVNTCQSNPQGIGSSAKLSASTLVQLLNSAAIVVSASNETKQKEAIVNYSVRVANALIVLLEATKATAHEPDERSFETLNKENVNVSNSIHALLGILGYGASEECEEAIRIIINAISSLEDIANAQLKSNEKILEEFGYGSSSLASIAGRILSVCRVSTTKLSQYSKEAAQIFEFIANTTRSTLKGSSGEVSFSPIIEVIQYCKGVTQYNGELQKMMVLAKKAAVAGSKVIAYVKDIAAQLTAPEEKSQQQEILRATKALANSASHLTKAIQTANTNKDPNSLNELLLVSKDLGTKALELRKTIGSSDVQSQTVNQDAVNHIVTATKNLGMASIQFIRSSTNVTNKSDTKANNELSSSSSSLTEAISALIQATSIFNPGYQQCIVLEETLRKSNIEVDDALDLLRSGNLVISGSDNVAESQENLSELCKSIGEDVSKMSSASKEANPRILVKAAKDALPRLMNISQYSKESASVAPTALEKKKVLDLTKELIQALLVFVGTCKVANPNDLALLENVSSSANGASFVISQLLGILQSNVAMIRDLDQLIEEIKAQIKLVPQPVESENKKYHKFRSEAQLLISKDLTEQINKLTLVGKDNTGDIGLCTMRIREQLSKWVSAIRGSIVTTKDKNSANEISTTTVGLLNNLVKLLEATKGIASDPSNADAIQTMKAISPSVFESITKVVQALKKGAVGENLCKQAIESINKTLGVIATSSIYSQAGQLEPEKDVLALTVMSLQHSLVDVTQNLLRSAEELENSVTQGQEVLGEKAIAFAKQVDSVSTASIRTASRIEDSNSQDTLLGAVKLLAIRAIQHILSTKDHEISNDKTTQQTFDSSKDSLRDSIKHLINTCQSVTSEASVAERELESAKEQILSMLSDIKGTSGSTPEDVVKAARECTSSISDLVFSTTQDELVAASQKALYATENLLNTSKTASSLASSPEIANELVKSTVEYARLMCTLLESSKLNKQDPSTQEKLEDASSDTNLAIQNVVTALRQLPNSSHLSLDEASDLERLASSELEACARVIEESAALLMRAKPRRQKDPNVIDEETLTDAILDAALAITKATGDLIGGATICQNEREEKMKTPGEKKYRNDPTWANGLISAAKAVAGAVRQLVAAANAAAQGKADQEVLIASVRAVAASTAQLVAASKVKADPLSTSQTKLAEFAKTVTIATSKLVEAAQRAAQYKEEMEDDNTDYSSVAGSTKAKFDQQIKILKLEAEIEKERRRMANLNKKEYAKD